MRTLFKYLMHLIVLCISMNVAHAQRLAKDIQEDALRKGPEVVALADLAPGMVVADVFGGGGYYSELISQRVGQSGRVYLHNNRAYLPYVDKELTERLANNRLPNVIRHDKEADDLAFKPQSLDAIFYVLGYHDLYYKADGWDINKDIFLKQLNQALKSDGTLLVVDHEAPKDSKTNKSQSLHRIEKAYVIDELEKYGFELVNTSNLLANQHDNLTVSALAPSIRRKTSRFILLFKKAQL
ncbi:hypothetical protein [Thalassotalea fusca]